MKLRARSYDILHNQVEGEIVLILFCVQYLCQCTGYAIVTPNNMWTLSFVELGISATIQNTNFFDPPKVGWFSSSDRARIDANIARFNQANGTVRSPVHYDESDSLFSDGSGKGK